MQGFINKLQLGSILCLGILCPTYLTAEDIKDELPTRVPTEELVEGIKSSDGRWFEVEMIIFEQLDAGDIRETFEQSVQNLTSPRQWNLIEPILKPELTNWLRHLPNCLSSLDPISPSQREEDVSPQQFWAQFQAYQAAIAHSWQFDEQLCLTASESLPDFWHWYLGVKKEDLVINTSLHWPKIPPRPTGPDFDDFHNVYLLAPQNLQLMEQYEKLSKQAKTRPLLHLGWRQPGLSKRKARPMYIKAGINYSEQFRYDGNPIVKPDEEVEPVDGQTELPALATTAQTSLHQPAMSEVEQFMKKLQNGAVVDFKQNKLVIPTDDKLPTETWQLDGYVTVHLNHYLFLDAEFNYRQLQEKTIAPKAFIDQLDLLTERDETPPGVSQEDASSAVIISRIRQDDSDFGPTHERHDDGKVHLEYLQNYSFKQTRRTYSGDLHYLDHPKLGVLFQIRKYRH